MTLLPDSAFRTSFSTWSSVETIACTVSSMTTIAAFIARMPGEITAVFRDVLMVYDESGLIGRDLFAVDGYKLPSNASRT